MPGRGRGGRGRGGRGRGGRGGGGRGRGGRGRGGPGRGRGRGGSAGPAASGSDKPQMEVEKDLDINGEVKDFFIGQASFEQHYNGQEINRTRYAAALAVCMETGVEISQNARVRALAAAWARHDHKLADVFLMNRVSFGLVEVLKAVNILDAGRQIRVIEKKLKLMEHYKVKVKPQKLNKHKSAINNLKAIQPKVGSASGAVCKHIQRWVRKFTTDELEYIALFYPTEPWKQLADICHFNPAKDFTALPWFLGYCFGNDAPEGTMVHRCKAVTQETVNNLLKEFNIPYSHIKAFSSALTTESKTKLAHTEKLDTIIWYYEDLQCKELDAAVEKRLNDGESVSLNNGKMLERLLTIKMIREGIPQNRGYGYWNAQPQVEADLTKASFIHKLIPLAQERLEKISLSLESPIVVIGDRSASMNVAVRTSTIIASILTVVVQAKLVFFNTENMDIPEEKMPTNVDSILEMAVNINADGGTAPAASLFPFYEKKQEIKTFIIVTDEEENTAFNGFRFAELYDKYYKEVYPANLVFVSFLHNQHAKGQMVMALQAKGYDPLQFKLDNQRPDMTKLDNLFGLLSAKSCTFEEELKRKEEAMTSDDIEGHFPGTQYQRKGREERILPEEIFSTYH